MDFTDNSQNSDFFALPSPDFLSHKADIGDGKDYGGQCQQARQVRPYQQQTLSQGQVSVYSARQLLRKYDVGGAHLRIHDGRYRLTVQIVRGEPVQIHLAVIIGQNLRCGRCLPHGVKYVGCDADDQRHKQGEKDPQRNHHHSRCGRMAAQHGEQDGERQPETDVDGSKEQQDEHPSQFLPRWRDSRGQQPHRSCDQSHGEDHQEYDGGSGQKLAVNDRIPVNRLGHKTV